MASFASEQTWTAAGAVVMTARGLSKLFGQFRAVDSVDLDIHERRIHALIGPNGAGKTSVLNLLAGPIDQILSDTVIIR